jgi:3-deoxy-D-manno-octulosonic-acid transferase
VLCQSEDDRGRWLAIGAAPERIAVVGNLKHDALPDAPVDRRSARSALGLDPERPLLVLGSVRPGEARTLARAWSRLPVATRDPWQVVAVPRHATATADLRREAAGADGWRWDDRMGVLAGYYAASDVAFVGGTLEPYGGHNPLEAAAAGAAVIVGKHHESQQSEVRMLAEGRGVVVVDGAESLEHAFGTLLGDPAARDERSRAGLEVARAARGAARRAVAYLAEWRLWPAA